MSANTGGAASDNVRYVAVARLSDRVPVAEYCAIEARELPKTLFDDKLERVLRSGRVGEHTRLTITDREVGSIHYDSDPVCLYLVVCARDYPQRTAFKFLAEVRRDFEAKFGAETHSARHSGLSRASRELFRGLCARYNQVHNVDKVAAVNLQVEEVKGVMQNNIQSALQNQENIETLLDQTDAMKNEATGFQRSAGRVKEKMWWQNLKMQIVIGVMIVFIILVIIISIVVKRKR